MEIHWHKQTQPKSSFAKFLLLLYKQWSENVNSLSWFHIHRFSMIQVNNRAAER